MRSGALNSAARLRLSSQSSKDEISHWRTFPFKCRSRLPMLLLASLGRHQICSSVKDSTQLFSRGQYCSSSLWREKLRNSELRFESKVWFIVRHVPEKNLYIPESPPRSECGLSFLRVDRFDRPGRQKRICRGAPAR